MFEQNLKILWIFSILSFSLIYLFFIRPQDKPTPFFSVSIMRMVMSAFSFVSLIATPLFFFSLSPEYSGFDFIYPFLWIYVATLTTYIITINIDMFRYGVPILMKRGGIDLKNSETNLAYEKIMRVLGNGKRR